MGTNEQRVWTWKDELPRRGLAWYGAYLGGRGTFLAPELLNALYPAMFAGLADSWRKRGSPSRASSLPAATRWTALNCSARMSAS